MVSWKDLQIKSKLLIGFGIVIALLIILTVSAYLGLFGTVSLNSTVVDNSDKSILMLEREIDHLKWVRQLEDLFVDESVTEVTVETNYRKCALGRWLYGEEIHKFTDGDPRLEQLVESIKEPHIHLHESAVKIQEAYREFDTSLEPLLYEIWIKHLNWARELDQALVAGREFTGILDPRESSFGKWYYVHEAQNVEFERLLKQWEGSHERLYATAATINQALQNGRVRQARALHDQRIVPNLAELSGHFKRTMDWIHQSRASQMKAMEIFQNESIPALETLQAELAKIRLRTEEVSVAAYHKMETGLIVVLAAITLVTVLAVIGGILAAIKITRSITTPIISLKDFSEEVAIGNLTHTLDLDQRDEVGLLGSAMNKMVADLKSMVQVAEKIADGNLATVVQVRSEKDMLGLALREMVSKLKAVISQISVSASEIASGSEQLASASQSMSQGATEQAASVEEISSSMTQISTQMQLNAENGEQANQLANGTRQDAEDGNNQMNEMIESMGKITSSSNDISKIIKVIDEIAFQINLLSLNAAVEAARAGKHGKGFAVVADEVRNLATRSAKAAAEINEMITISVGQVEEGTVIVDKTAKALQKIVTSIEKITDIVSEIAVASKEQATGAKQITQGLEQIDRVTQQNSAHAEESASSAEELSSQAMILNQLIDQFTIDQSHDVKALTQPDIQVRPDLSADEHPVASTQSDQAAEDAYPEPPSKRAQHHGQRKIIHLDADEF